MGKDEKVSQEAVLATKLPGGSFNRNFKAASNSVVCVLFYKRIVSPPIISYLNGRSISSKKYLKVQELSLIGYYRRVICLVLLFPR